MVSTFTKRHRSRFGAESRVRGDLSISAIGSATGEAVDGAKFLLRTLQDVIFMGPSTKGKEARYDRTTGKIRVLSGGLGGVVTESWPDVKGGEFGDQVAGGAAAVNGEFIIAFADANVTAKTTIAAQPNTAAGQPGNAAAGRNVCVQFTTPGGGTLPAAVGNATVVGTDQFGAAQTEVISLAGLNDVVLAAGNEVFILGNKVFATVTSLTLSVNLTTSIADLDVSLGLGTIFALRGSISAESDVKSVRKDAAAITSATYVGSATTHSLDMGADVADNVDIVVTYDSIDAEQDAANGENCGTFLCEAIGT
jgi:hypothetical protein